MAVTIGHTYIKIILRNTFICGVIKGHTYLKIISLDTSIGDGKKGSYIFKGNFAQHSYVVVTKGHTYLKVVSATFLLVCFVCLKERTCETRKDVFYFTSKVLFVLEIIKF